MFHLLEKRVQTAVSDYIHKEFEASPPVAIEQPKEAAFGEIALPIAFQLAKQLKKAPKVLAAHVVNGLGPIVGIQSIEVAGNGYLNVRFDRGHYGHSVLQPSPPPAGQQTGKIIVEHTNINPNKAAHIGHLRNAVLGDTFVRMLRACGRTVEVQNYIDNTGVQVADVVAGFHFIEAKSVPEVQALINAPKFDYLCWDLYARTSSYFKDHPEAIEWRNQTLRAVEADEGVLAELGHLVADAIVQKHLATMLRLNIRYDVLPRESEILHLKFWATAFDLLKERKAIYLETVGKNSGCWVMPGSAFDDAKEDSDSKVIVRSNGIVTYVGKDIAYQLWKFGLLGKDFFYEALSHPGGYPLWVTTDRPVDDKAPAFGHASQVFNVIDSRQSYLQDVVTAGLRALGYEEQAAQSIHFSYEMVALTPATCVELGIELSEEDRKRSYLEVSGRKGLGVKADDLINTLTAKALEEVQSRHADMSAEQNARVANQIAVGALRFFMLRFTRNTVIAFDLKEALSFEGETGPYVQYAAVRARNISRKLESRGESLPDFSAELTKDAMSRQLVSDDLWQLLLAASKNEIAVSRAIQSGEPAHVARYAFQLAQSFNTFYHDFPVLSEENREKKVFLLWMTQYFRQQIERTVEVLGIEVPEYM